MISHHDFVAGSETSREHPEDGVHACRGVREPGESFGLGSDEPRQPMTSLVEASFEATTEEPSGIGGDLSSQPLLMISDRNRERTESTMVEVCHIGVEKPFHARDGTG